eukprot:3574269-Rhodomonas_salina.3
MSDGPERVMDASRIGICHHPSKPEPETVQGAAMSAQLQWLSVTRGSRRWGKRGTRRGERKGRAEGKREGGGAGECVSRMERRGGEKTEGRGDRDGWEALLRTASPIPSPAPLLQLEVPPAAASRSFHLSSSTLPPPRLRPGLTQAAGSPPSDSCHCASLSHAGRGGAHWQAAAESEPLGGSPPSGSLRRQQVVILILIVWPLRAVYHTAN